MDAQRGRWRQGARSGVLRATSTALATVTLAGLGVAPAAAAGPAGGDLVPVIVEGGAEAAAAAVGRVGGVVDARLPVVDGLSARVPADAVPTLRRTAGVRAVTPDVTLRTLDSEWGDDDTRQDEKASKATGRWEAEKDLGSANKIAEAIGVQNVWDKEHPRREDLPLTGAGVGVALLDTGVTPVAGLNGRGTLVNGPDLSTDSQSPHTRHLDGYGHGTHMAGLIVGRDIDALREDAEDAAETYRDPDRFTGMAPDATLVNVKLGASDGSVDVSQVIAGIDWVVTNRASHNIRVINLSYGTESTQSYLLDPLAHAVESAWHAGIVVVAAAGNDGEEGPSPLTMPAADPFVLAVGSADNAGKAKPADWRVGPWTNSGTAERRPDLLAPGKSVVSLRTPGSVSDTEHPEGRVHGDADGRFFRGSGTSQSAAVVSGAVALLLQRNPELTPDQVKALLVATADRLGKDASPAQGAGLLDLDDALAQLEKRRVPAGTQTWQRSTGLGTLEATRGGHHLVDFGNGDALTGERDIHGVPWDAATWASASSAGTAWSGGVWNGTRWAGDGWADRRTWAPATWDGTTWAGVTWSEHDWSRMRWRAEDWQRMRWRAEDWQRMRWRTAGQW